MSAYRLFNDTQIKRRVLSTKTEHLTLNWYPEDTGNHVYSCMVPEINSSFTLRDINPQPQGAEILLRHAICTIRMNGSSFEFTSIGNINVTKTYRYIEENNGDNTKYFSNERFHIYIGGTPLDEYLNNPQHRINARTRSALLTAYQDLPCSTKQITNPAQIAKMNSLAELTMRR